ncbi:MAG: hypothetical protein A3J94_16325 [Syntrophus sp. RIFOXYC2_FULL_54_9]|nr:MAG: hypothetical protein A3J94_16325 [Syntrophus sp. RIFOXYC2_FULL_54_9]
MNRCDVLVIGSGAAGTFAALAAAEQGARVCIASKGSLLYGNTRLAGGIVACPGFADNDLPRHFVEDVFQAGERISRRNLVELVAEGGLQSLQALEEWGYLFKRNDQGEPRLTQAGGHRSARTMICCYRGSSLANLLRCKIACHDRIRVLESHVLYRLILTEGGMSGALFLDMYRGEPVVIEAPAVVLATGGAGMVYAPHTDNTREVTGDGMALALLVGARLVDMEFMQWMPFAVTSPPDLVGINCGEPSSAGPQGVLLNCRGRVILRSFHRMTRAQVARVIFREIKNGGGTRNGGVIFDPRANRGDPDGERTYQERRSLGTLDVVRQAYGQEAYQWSVPYEVAPSVHFTLGGIVVDNQGSTGVEGLFAAGEVTGGFHGADRLGSAALTECFVVGSTAGYHAWEKSRRKMKVQKRIDCRGLVRELHALFDQPGRETPEKLARELGDLMWRRAGGVRDRQDLEKARRGIADLVLKSEEIKTPGLKKWNLPVQAAIELQSMLVVAEAMVLASQTREETRGTHYRLDYPELSKTWEGKNIVIERGIDGVLTASVKDTDEL